MQDFRELHLYTRAGRQHVQDWIGFLHAQAELLALVPIFQPDLPLAENAENLRDAGKIDHKVTGIKWCQGDYLYCGDTAVLLLVAYEKDRQAFVSYLDAIRRKFHQEAYVFVDRNSTALVTETDLTMLTPFTGSLENLDELIKAIIPDWKATEGNFDRSIGYVQMRDYQTRKNA